MGTTLFSKLSIEEILLCRILQNAQIKQSVPRTQGDGISLAISLVVRIDAPMGNYFVLHLLA
jgi:hypothetical protein